MRSRKILEKLSRCLKEAMQKGLGKQGLIFPIDLSTIDDEELKEICSQLEAVFNMINESYSYSERLAQGDLKSKISRNNIFGMPLKGLQASLAHLTWQARRVAEDDLHQQVDFLGEFSESFNQMISSLREKKIVEQRLKIITDVLGEGIFLIDSEGKIIFTNPEAIHLLGYSFEEIEGIFIHEVIHKQYLDGTLYEPEKNPLLVAIKSGKNYNDDNGAFICKSGFLMPVSIACRIIFKDDILDGAVIAFRDISAQKEAENELIQREKLQGVLEMTGAVCHEINQPLMSISGNSELLLLNTSENQPEYKKIKTIFDQSQRIGHITKKLMKITQYKTKDYLKGKIIDIDAASNENQTDTD